MNDVGYLSPFVPPEWIAAHGLRPVWLTLDRAAVGGRDATRRGICPCAGALVASAIAGATPRTLVLTTACDQMRYASAYLDTVGDIRGFLLNVPSTWQSPRMRQLYRAELERLGRFLVQSGGCEPTSRQLEATIADYDEQRTAGQASSGSQGIPLALLGGPLLADGGSFLGMVEKAGGRIVVDGSEGGERTLPAPVDHRKLKIDPLDELARIYFDTIPDVFRRPNTRLYEWLGERLSANSVRGIILRRYPFCDLWHAELHRLRQWSDVPVLDIDVAAGEEGESSRTLGRIEAFLEILR